MVLLHSISRRSGEVLPLVYLEKLGLFFGMLFEEAASDIRTFHLGRTYQHFIKIPAEVREWLLAVGLPVGVDGIQTISLVSINAAYSDQLPLSEVNRRTLRGVSPIFATDLKAVLSAFQMGLTPTITALTHDGCVDVVEIFFLARDFGLIYCEEFGDSRFSYFILWEARRNKVERVYFPKSKVLILSGEKYGGKKKSFSIYAYNLLKILFSVRGKIGGWLDNNKKDVGIVLWMKEQSHLGHFVWDEMSSIEKIIDTLKVGTPYMYPLASSSGVEHYGPIENIYPEFTGRINNTAKTYEEVFVHAMTHSIRPVPLLGRRIRQSSRMRIISAISKDPDLQTVSSFVDTFNIDPISKKRRLVLAFQLRLVDRFPINYLSFLSNLVRELLKDHQSLGVVVDGLNRKPGTAATKSMPLFALRDGPGGAPRETGLSEEFRFVELLRKELGGLNVDVVSCIGTTMLINLLWLSRVDFFVAPLGGGLVKLRWVLDKPGIALTSNINLEKCKEKDIYYSKKQMEAPFSSMLYTEPDEVIDILNPGDDIREFKNSPFGNNFHLNESKVINKIKNALVHTGVATGHLE